MASDAELRQAGFTVEYAFTLQNCTVRITHPIGLDATARASNRFRARSLALEEIRTQRRRQKTRRLLERHLTGRALRDALEMCDLRAYKTKPQTGYVFGGLASARTGEAS